MPRGVLVLDTFDTTAIGFKVRHPLRGWREGIHRQLEARSRPHSIEDIVTIERATDGAGSSRGILSRARPIDIRGFLTGATHAQFETRRDELLWRLSGDPAVSTSGRRVEVKFDTAAVRHRRAFLNGEPQISMRRGGVPVADVRIRMLSFDPRAYEDATTTVGPFTSKTK